METNYIPIYDMCICIVFITKTQTSLWSRAIVVILPGATTEASRAAQDSASFSEVMLPQHHYINHLTFNHRSWLQSFKSFDFNLVPPNHSNHGVNHLNAWFEANEANDWNRRGKSQIMYLMSPKYEWFEGGNHKLKPEVQGDTDVDTDVLGRGSFLGISTNV